MKEPAESKANKQQKPAQEDMKLTKLPISKLESFTSQPDPTSDEETKKTACVRNYLENEDLQLYILWLEKTEYILQKGTNHNFKTFWNLVAKHYTKEIPTPVRS